MTVELTADAPTRRVARDAVVVAVDALVGWLREVSEPIDDAACIDRIAALERLQSAAAGAQVVEIVRFADARAVADESSGVPVRRRGLDVPAQVGLARKVSAATATRQVAQARALVDDLPETLDLLRSGQISAWVAALVVRETSALSPDDRRAADADLSDRLPTLGPRQAEAAARRTSIRLDPASPLRRGRTARSDRRVSIRPAPDTMTLLTGFLPVEQGVAAYAALDRHARSLRSQGDERSLGQIMADTLVERVTGQATASAVPVEVGVTISLDALVGASDNPAAIDVVGPIPAQTVRDLVDESLRTGAAVWLRRLLTDPVDHSVATIDTKRRRYAGPVAALIDRRDQTCRITYCAAPIRQRDHVEPWRHTHTTTANGGQGLCAYHNYAKEQPGWASRVLPGPRHHVVTTTPTGHTYDSYAPPALGP